MTRVAFFDVDGTLINEGVWTMMLSHESLGQPAKRRVYADVLPVWLAMKAKVGDEARFRQRWIRAVARLLKGWPRAQTAALFDWLVHEQVGDSFRPDVTARLRDHLAQGDHIVLVSGMYEEIVQRFAARLGAHVGSGSVLGYTNDVCTGTIIGMGCVGEHKPGFIRSNLETHGLSTDFSECYAYADSYSDVALLSTVGHPVATYPDKPMRAYAEKRGWEILGTSQGR